jgi:hypothetical protein
MKKSKQIYTGSTKQNVEILTLIKRLNRFREMCVEENEEYISTEQVRFGEGMIKGVEICINIIKGKL